MVDHDAQCVICKASITPSQRDHDRNRCSWCFEVWRGAEEVRISMDEMEQIKELSKQEGHPFHRYRD